MATNLIEKFLKLVNKRDEKLEKYCNGVSWAELCNYPEERDWYKKNIFPIDEKIVNIANLIIDTYNVPCGPTRNVVDVYSNQHIIKLVESNTKKIKEDTLTK